MNEMLFPRLFYIQDLATTVAEKSIKINAMLLFPFQFSILVENATNFVKNRELSVNFNENNEAKQTDDVQEPKVVERSFWACFNRVDFL